MRPRSIAAFPLAVALVLLVGCRKGDAPEGQPSPSASAPVATASATTVKVTPPTLKIPKEPDAKLHTWLANDSLKYPKATETLGARFEAPPGYARVKLESGSFGNFLRRLPLAAPGTPVLSYKGQELRKGDDEFLAGVVAIDIGKSDLQQSPDAIVRLHAEWAWSAGKRDMTYRGATGLDMPLHRWAKGERIVPVGRGVFWLKKAKPVEMAHAEFRRFLDAVFTYVNSSALVQQAQVLEAKDVQPGDFFVHLEKPNHSLMILDIAEKAGGGRVALFGQALNPAQSLFVLRLGTTMPWFSLRPGEDIITPYTEAFTWEGLRRLQDKPVAAATP